MITRAIIITRTIVWMIVTRIGDNESDPRPSPRASNPPTITGTEGEGCTWIIRQREIEREGVNERVIDRIVIRRTILDGLRGLGHLMHVVPSPWIRAGVS